MSGDDVVDAEGGDEGGGRDVEHDRIVDGDVRLGRRTEAHHAVVGDLARRPHLLHVDAKVAGRQVHPPRTHETEMDWLHEKNKTKNKTNVCRC